MKSHEAKTPHSFAGSGNEQHELLRSIDHLVMKSERLRAAAVAMMASVFAVLALAVAIIPAALPEGKELLFRPSIAAMVALLSLTTVYELMVIAMIKRWNLKNHFPAAWFRFANALIEVMVPTYVIWEWSHAAGFIPTVGGVLPWLYFPFIAASALHLNPRLCWFTGGVAAVAFVWLCLAGVTAVPARELTLLTSTTSFLLKGSLLLISGGVAGFVAGQLRNHLIRAVELARERDRAVNIFGQHVSPQVASRLIEQRTTVDAEQRHVCVLFLDIRGFSSIAASRTPAAVMEYLNTLFTPMIAIVNQHGGIVNKFLGDGFMAIFGAPFDDPSLHQNAAKCALKLLECVEKLNADEKIVPTRIGIGIHAGKAMAGTVGSNERKEYTLLGDTVNAAARIEQQTKHLGAQVLVSSVVLEDLTEEREAATDLGEVTLRGISQPLRLFRLV